jgi:hypothetical protein
MVVFGNCIALFISGAAFGASVAHWYGGAGNAWGLLSTSLLIAVIAAASLSRTFARTQQSSPEAGSSAA